ncbi:MAG: PQQ-dependent dehydrogenase, methanol/ethanol family [Pseudomonadota bacterium]
MRPAAATCPALWLSVILSAGLLVACSRAPAPAKPAGKLDLQRLLAADKEPQSWLTSGRDFGKSHYSPLAQINRDNVRDLGFAWEYRTQTNRGLQATPLVIDGVMYTSGVAGRAYALDARSGKLLWAFDPQVDGQVTRKACCDSVNRGVAVWQGKVYVAALDGRLFALDAATGAVVWQVDTVIDHQRAYTSTGAPEIAGKAVVIGNAGGEYDARGYVTAYDLVTGKQLWRFFTVPGDPKLPFEHPELEWASKTWDPNSRWDLGLGGSPWDGMAYDPELDLLYIGTGNAAPWSGKVRSPSGGANLFTCSLLAINATTGVLEWSYQQVPGDQWDFDSNAPMILTQLTLGDTVRKVLLHAPKNGLFYVIDRETGQLLSAKDFAPVNWTTGIDFDTATAVIDEVAVDYRKGPKVIWPWGGGAHSWTPMAFSLRTGLTYIPVSEAANIQFDATTTHERRVGRRNVVTSSIVVGAAGGGLASPVPPAIRAAIEAPGFLRHVPHDRPHAYLDAWDPVRQQRIWRVELANFYDRSGVLATAGGIVVQGTTAGELRFYDDGIGTVLSVLDVGTSIVAAPMTYELDGVQYIAVMAGLGGGPLSFAPPPDSAAARRGNEGRILVFKLGGGAVPMPPLLPPAPPFPEPPPLTADATTIAQGAALFGENCASCHRNSSAVGSTPDLRRMSTAGHAAFNDVVLRGALRPRGMPQWDDALSATQVDAIHAYLISLAHQAYAAQAAAR